MRGWPKGSVTAGLLLNTLQKETHFYKFFKPPFMPQHLARAGWLFWPPRRVLLLMVIAKAKTGLWRPPSVFSGDFFETPKYGLGLTGTLACVVSRYSRDD
jgi:hypothetical protein